MYRNISIIHGDSNSKRICDPYIFVADLFVPAHTTTTRIVAKSADEKSRTKQRLMVSIGFVDQHAAIVPQIHAFKSASQH